MKPLELNILFFGDDNPELRELGIDLKSDDYTVDKMTFYSINAISRDAEEDENWTTIFANGDEFVCTDSYEVVKQKIQANL